MNKEKIINIIIVVIVLILIFLIFFFPKEKETMGIDYSFNEKKYKKNSQEYIEEKSKLLVLHLNYLFEEDRTSVNIYEISSEDLLNILNNLLAINGEATCYDKKVLSKKAYEYFGIQNIEYQNDSLYYTIDNNRICFDEIFININSFPNIKSYKENTDGILVELIDNHRFSWTLTYIKENDNIFLAKIDREVMTE